MQGNEGITQADIMLLLQGDTGDAAIITDMVSAARRQYVLKMHPYTITRIATGPKEGKYKTYIGKPRKEVVRKTEKELISVLYDYYLKIDKRQNTFGNIFNEMLTQLVEEDNRSLKTESAYRYVLKSFLPEDFFNRSISEITEGELKHIIVEQTQKLHPRMDHLSKAVQLIKKVFSYAMEKRKCLTNPAIYLDAANYRKNCTVKKKGGEEKAFSPEQLAQLRDAFMLDSANPRALMGLLAIETGMRRAELSALHWSDVGEKYLHIHRQQIVNSSEKPKRAMEVEYTKNEREHPRDGRYFPITPKIQEILELAKQLPGDSHYVFHDGDNWVLNDGYSHYLRRVCHSLGVSTTNNHAFRMALNTQMMDTTLNLVQRSLLLGHSPEVNQRFYSNTDKRQLDSIYEAYVQQ